MAKSQSAPEQFQLHIQSNDPDKMGFDRWSGGVGTIVKSVFAPAMFSRESGKHALFHLLTIQEEDGTEHSARYLRGFFGNTEKEGKKSIGKNSYPVKEDRTIAGPPGKSLEELLEEYAELAKGKGEDNTIPSIPEDEQHLYEGVYVGTIDKDVKGQNNDDKQLMAKIKELTRTDPANPESSPFNGDERSDALCGHKFQWDLLPQLYPFKQREGEQKSDYPVLIPIHYFGMDEEWEAENKPNGKAKETKELHTTGKTTASEVESVEDQDPFENDVEGVVVAFLTKVGKPVVKKDISTAVLNHYKDPDDKKKAIGLCGNNKWMTDGINRPWSYEGGQFSI